MIRNFIFCTILFLLISEIVSANDWTSEKADLFMAGHSFITEQAIEIVKNDIGICDTQLKPMIDLINGPDIYETTYYTWVGHFYDPDTGLNYFGVDYNTALTNFIYHAVPAVDLANTDWVKEFAYALHYLEDACVPHHASNRIVGESQHRAFEHYAQTIQPQTIVLQNELPYNFTNDFQKDLTDILRGCSIKAKAVIDNIENSPETAWFPYANLTLRNAQQYTALAVARIILERNKKYYENCINN